MRIGIDLDNTIICYQESFKSVARKYGYVCCNINSGKLAVKDEVLRNENGQYNWEKLQGLVYGKYIQQAKLYPNFLKFLLSAVSFGDVQLDIVSHKTVLHVICQDKFTIKCARILTSCGLTRCYHSQKYFTNSLMKKFKN